MVNIVKEATNAGKAGAILYVAGKLAQTGGQLGLNFIPKAVPPAASYLLGAISGAVVLKKFGKGKLVHDLADFMAASAVAGSIRTIDTVEKNVNKLLAPIQKIGADAATKARIDASTKGYFDEISGYEELSGYEEAVPAMRGYTSVHGF